VGDPVREPRVRDSSESGVWNYVANLACDGHRDAAEDEALAKEKHYRLMFASKPISMPGHERIS